VIARSLADLKWWDHRSALWWLGLLYRRPYQFRKALAGLPPRRAFAASGLILGHALPHLVILACVLRWLLFSWLDPSPQHPPPLADLPGAEVRARALFDGIASAIALGIAFGIVFALALVIVGGIAIGLAAGITSVIAFVITFVIAYGISGSIAVTIILAVAFGIACGIVIRITFGITVGVAIGITAGIAVGMAGGIASGVAIGIAILRVYYQPLHVCFIWPVLQTRWYLFHPVTWDDMCSVPFPGLHRLLVAYTETLPEAGEAEIERLISSYPSQRMQALRARTTLIARAAGAEHDLARIDAIVARLPEGSEGFLSETPLIREMVGEITDLQRFLDAIDRPILREPYASRVVKEIESFRGRISGFHEPLVSEFRAAADKWFALAKRQLAEVQGIVRKESPQLFRAGDPVDRAREAFVPRISVLEQLGRQVMFTSGCPGLLIYGRRRMGKSTLLRNLGGFLPDSVGIVSISMQNPAAFSSFASLIRLIAEEIKKNTEVNAGPNASDLSRFFAFLNYVNGTLIDQQKRLILAFDEFENFDMKIGEGVFDCDLLATIRESVQMHRQLIWAFAGSHHITELKHAPWDSYLVSIRTIEVPPFSAAETRVLLTEPLKESPLFERGALRPRYDAAFWSEGGIEWIHEQTAGWPHLVQLLAGTAVDLVNDANVAALDRQMLQKAAERSIVDGDTVLRQLMRGESELPGEWDYLVGFRKKDEQQPPQDEAIFQSLRRRQLVTAGGMWRLRVPLMQRWLRKRG